MSLTKSIRQILFACSTMAFAASSLATVGIQNPPPGPGQIPDYFGVTGNYANSPQPVLATVSIFGAGTGAVAVASTYDYNSSIAGAYTGGITDIQLLNSGTGYDETTVVTINGGPGVTPITVTAEVFNGAIVGILEFNPFVRDTTTGLNTTAANTSYIGNPANPLTHLGSGFTVPVAGTGLKKFVDLLPGIPGVSSYTAASGYNAGVTPLGQALPVAVPDTTTYPGSDYYEIAETAYTQKLHSSLPATHLRGYKQLNAPAGSASTNNQYLGPIIIAQKNRPVRVKLVNLLPLKGAAGLGDQLPLPVDHTYMGASGATDTDNRTALHMHGGNTPWISDGTPRQWIKPAGEVGANKGVSATNVPDMYFTSTGAVVPACSSTVTASCSLPADQAQANLPAGATTNPGDGALTFFFTNEQSARLMFYHDHAEGLTRLNVYDGLAAGYLLQDDTEQDLVNGTNLSGNNIANLQVLPPLVDTIPLVIQEKTFVPDNTIPVLNFYGPFASQLNSSDPTWRWGSGVAATSANPNGTGDLWVPHVYMPNQNPGDISGANSFGRWDYGPWFWPPFTGITHGALTNPYYDANCISSVDNYCEGQYVPGVPNGNKLSATDLTNLNYDPTFATLSEPTGTPEAINDTSLVNGTVYPVLKVDPKQYRLRILSVGNDRMLNLSLVVAADNRTNNTALQNEAPVDPTTPKTVMCDGSSQVDPSFCTEARMVPFNAAQHKVSKFPNWWYTAQNGGVSFDGRPSGVFDPATRGPAMVQIGTDGGFLSTPVVIQNQPVNFEYNLKNIVVTNVKEHALLLGPAERADVVVDFRNFAGSTLLMYNDAPAPMPAFDLRLDYFTGNFDNTDTGGAFSTLPGYGPNTRTLMQIQVASTCVTGSTCTKTHPVDDTGTINMANLTTAVQTAFRTSQEPIIVPQAAYNKVYGSAVNDSTLSSNANHNLALIQDYSLNFTPYAAPATSGAVTATVLMDMQPKTIIEDWTMDYGRMNALLGVEIPKTTATTNTALPLGYTDAPTELVKISPNDSSTVGAAQLTDGTTLWRITHNGVDSHAIHFHLFHVQIVNRVGWDGGVRPTEPNELGWKDTVRMNPLEDIVVALRPKVMTTLPFKVPNSHRLLDPAQAAGGGNGFYNLDPSTGNASTVTNVNVNYGWEYIWHCHILGHEENDMMRTIVVAQTPDTPSALSAIGATAVTVNWIDNSLISNWVTIQRALDSAFTLGLTTFNVKEDECTVQTGCAKSYVDNNAPALTSVYYRVMANNTVGAGDVNRVLPATLLPSVAGGSVTPLMPGLAGYDNVTSQSVWSSSVARLAVPIAIASPTSLTFPSTAVAASSANQTITLRNTGAGILNIASIVTSNPFARVTTGTGITNSCGATLAVGATCNIIVRFTPTIAGTANGSVTITDNSGGVVGTVQTIALSGSTPVATASISASTLTFPATIIATNSATKTIVLSNTGTGPLIIASITASASFTRVTNGVTGSCGTTLAAGSACNIGVRFTPTDTAAATGSLVISDNSGGITGTTQTVTLSGSTALPAASVSAASLSFAAITAAVSSPTQTLVLTNTGLAPLSIVSITVPSPFARVITGITNSCGTTLAAGAACNIGVNIIPTTIGSASGNLMITDNAGGVTGTTQTVTLSGSGILPVAAAFSVASAATSSAVSATGQSLTAANIGVNVLTTSTPIGVASRTVTNISAVSHTGGGTTPATATVSITAAGAVSMVLTSPVTTTGATGNTARQVSKRGTYSFTYTITNGGFTSQPATVSIVVN